MRRLLLPTFVASSLWLLLAACSAAGTGDNETGGTAGLSGAGGGAGAGEGGAGGQAGPGGAAGQGGASAGVGGTGAGTAGTGAGKGGSAGTIGLGGGGGSGPVGDVLLYAHTAQELYRLDTNDLTKLESVGTFDCITGSDQMIDLGVDKDGKVWGVSFKAVHRLELSDDKTTVHCASTIDLKTTDDIRFYGMSFAPAGVVAADKEVLIAGNTAGELWAIDDQGTLKLLGNLGTVPASDGQGHPYDSKRVGKNWQLSGDVVFLANEGEPLGFATVRDCVSLNKDCSEIDTLVELDMKKLGKAAPGSMIKAVRGQIVQRQGCSDGFEGKYGNMFGIAAWGDRVYGFSRNGHLVDIDTADGSACLVRTFDATTFFGAGVTTIVEVIPPPDIG